MNNYWLIYLLDISHLLKILRLGYQAFGMKQIEVVKYSLICLLPFKLISIKLHDFLRTLLWCSTRGSSISCPFYRRRTPFRSMRRLWCSFCPSPSSSANRWCDSLKSRREPFCPFQYLLKVPFHTADSRSLRFFLRLYCSCCSTFWWSPYWVLIFQLSLQSYCRFSSVALSSFFHHLSL